MAELNVFYHIWKGEMEILNYREYLFKSIGRRIREVRTKIKKETQQEFSDSLQKNHIYMDRFRLSQIENGKVHKKKNPYLLSKEHIYGISNYIEYSPKELIFGNKAEQEAFVKLVLLAIIINGEKHYETKEIINPLINTEKAQYDTAGFVELARYNIHDEMIEKDLRTFGYSFINRNLTKPESNAINRCIKWYEEHYGFFADYAQHQNISYLLGEFEEELEVKSNLLINILFGDPDFAYDFMSGSFNIDKLTSNMKDNFSNLIENRGQYGGLAIDWKKFGYSIFIKAFNAMWHRNKEGFIEYFESNLFNLDIVECGLKDQNDEFFHSLITDFKFERDLYKILNKERYNEKTMMGHRIVQNYIESYLIELSGKSNDLTYESGYNSYKYNFDIHQLTQLYNELKDKKVEEPNPSIFHINDYVNIISFNKR